MLAARRIRERVRVLCACIQLLLLLLLLWSGGPVLWSSAVDDAQRERVGLCVCAPPVCLMQFMFVPSNTKTPKRYAHQNDTYMGIRSRIRARSHCLHGATTNTVSGIIVHELMR